MNPVKQRAGALVGALVDATEFPFAQGRVDEPLARAVGLRPLEPGETTVQFQVFAKRDTRMVIDSHEQAFPDRPTAATPATATVKVARPVAY